MAAHKPTPPFAWRFLVVGVTSILRFLFGWRIQATKPDRLPSPGRPLVVVSNHTASLEPFLVAYTVWKELGLWVQPLAKAEAFNIPVIGWLGRKAGGVPVHREDKGGRADAFASAVQKLAEGATVWLGPEGTITHDGNLLPLRTGAARLALRAGADVLVVTHVGAQRAFSPVAKLPHRGAIVTMSMDLLTAYEDDDDDSLNGRMGATMEDRSRQLQASHPQRDPSQPWWPPYSNPPEPSRTGRQSIEKYRASMTAAIADARKRMEEYAHEHHLDEKVLDARRAAAKRAADAREAARQAAAQAREKAEHFAHEHHLDEKAEHARERAHEVAEKAREKLDEVRHRDGQQGHDAT